MGRGQNAHRSWPYTRGALEACISRTKCVSRAMFLPGLPAGNFRSAGEAEMPSGVVDPEPEHCFTVSTRRDIDVIPTPPRTSTILSHRGSLYHASLDVSLRTALRQR
jgi:hypothetical protein